MWMLNTTTQVSEGMKPWKIEVSMQFFNTTKSTHKLRRSERLMLHKKMNSTHSMVMNAINKTLKTFLNAG